MLNEKNVTKWVGSRTSLIVHTLFFISMFCLRLFGVSFDTVFLFLTTIVSLEAIYLSIFIQMTVNQNTESLEEVEEDIEEIQADVGEIQTDVDEIQTDVDEIQHDVDEIQTDVGEIQHDVDEIEKDNSEIQKSETEIDLDSIQEMLKKILTEIDRLKSK